MGKFQNSVMAILEHQLVGVLPTIWLSSISFAATTLSQMCIFTSVVTVPVSIKNFAGIPLMFPWRWQSVVTLLRIWRSFLVVFLVYLSPPSYTQLTVLLSKRVHFFLTLHAHLFWPIMNRNSDFSCSGSVQRSKERPFHDRRHDTALAWCWPDIMCTIYTNAN